MSPPPTLALLGGTGRHGRGLALRLAAAGHPVLIGSRVAERAVTAAAEVSARLEASGRAPATPMRGMLGFEAAGQAEVVFLTLPFDVLDQCLEGRGALLAGRIVVDVTAPLRVAAGRFELAPVPEGSASAHVQRLAPAARVVGGFKNVAAGALLDLESAVLGDVLLASDDETAKATIARLVRDIPDLRPLDAGPLANATFLESLTALELNLNRLHRARTAVRFLGV